MNKIFALVAAVALTLVAFAPNSEAAFFGRGGFSSPYFNYNGYNLGYNYGYPSTYRYGYSGYNGYNYGYPGTYNYSLYQYGYPAPTVTYPSFNYGYSVYPY